MILSIETSTTSCSVALHDQGHLIADQSYHVSQSHSGLLPTLIDQLLSNTGIGKSALQAVALSEGPGSYTGLRIGSSIAKGLCYALDLPLISISTLDILVERVREMTRDDVLIAPMIDARRMEVFMKLVDRENNELWSVRPLIIEESTFSAFPDKAIVLVGNGASKCRTVIQHEQVIYRDRLFPDARHMGELAWACYVKKEFCDVAYYEPNYVKAFQTKSPRNRVTN